VEQKEIKAAMEVLLSRARSRKEASKKIEAAMGVLLTKSCSPDEEWELEQLRTAWMLMQPTISEIQERVRVKRAARLINSDEIGHNENDENCVCSECIWERFREAERD
jgi:hypothetical protein